MLGNARIGDLDLPDLDVGMSGQNACSVLDQLGIAHLAEGADEPVCTLESVSHEVPVLEPQVTPPRSLPGHQR